MRIEVKLAPYENPILCNITDIKKKLTHPIEFVLWVG